jgi:Ca-activated chloride channel family protein
MKRPTSPAPSVSFGLIAWLEATRIALPLKGVECRFDVTGNLAKVELDQIYFQNADRPLDCTYTFPLPAGAAVYRCELHVNGRVIRAKVEEQQAARRIFEEQKAAGRRAALVETERENLFTLSLGNVQPDDVIVVRFAWFSVLDRAGDNLRLLIPTCPGVRYIPGNPLLRASSGNGTVDDTDQVPDASRITPPRIDAFHPDAAYFSIEGRLSAVEVDCGAISSPSHAIHVRETEAVATITLSGHAAVPDRDFVLAWRESKVAQLAPRSWRWSEGNATYALVQLRAPADVAVSENYEQDVYFLVDRSGSMAGAKWDRTCQALHAFVGLLGAADRVWITLFESSFRDFSEAPMAAPAVLKDRGFRSMIALGTGGGTELLPAAKHVLEQISRHSVDRHVSIILITDGQVGNEAAVLDAFGRSGQIRVHTFGIDTAVNDAFLKSLARQHRGGCWLQTPDDDIAGTISALGDRLRRPVLTGLSVAGAWESGSAMPDLHAGEVATVSLRGEVTAPVEITGSLPDGRDYHLTVEPALAGSEAVKLLWARERIATLLDTGRQPEAIALARQYNLVCRGAAFIAWDEAEQVAVAEETVVQPSLEQAVMQRHPCAAAPAASPAPGQAPRRAGFAGKTRSRFDSDVVYYKMSSDAGAPKILGRLAEWLRNSWGNPQNATEATKIMINLVHQQIASPKLRKSLESHFGNALASRPDAGGELLQKLGPLVSRIGSLEKKLANTGAPAALLGHLLEWALAFEDAMDERVKALEKLLSSLDVSVFSAVGRARQWRVFFERHIGQDSEAFAVAAEWLPAIRDPLSNEPTNAPS